MMLLHLLVVSKKNGAYLLRGKTLLSHRKSRSCSLAPEAAVVPIANPVVAPVHLDPTSPQRLINLPEPSETIQVLLEPSGGEPSTLSSPYEEF